MHPLEREVGGIIETEGLLKEGETTVIGVSGGPDSMALLHVLARLAPLIGLRLAAVYVDHGLRPAETELEADLVGKHAALLGIAAKIVKVPVRDLVRERGLSVEHAARILRYRCLEDAAREEGGGKIAVAHTADDQAEEVLLRLIRGTGRKGLAGMAMQSRGGMVIRPFLQIPKGILLAYLADRDIPFFEDSSNRERVFLRNRVRHDLLPYLAGHFNPNIRQVLRQTAVILQAEEDVLEDLADKAYSQVVEEEKQAPGRPPAAVFKIVPFSVQPAAIRRRVLEKLLWKMGCAPGFRQIEQLMALSGSRGDGACVHLAAGLRVVKNQDRLLFSYPRGIGPRRGDLPAGGDYFEISMPGFGKYAVPELGKSIDLQEVSGTPDFAGQRPDADYLDADALRFPLVLRSPRPGDRFRPLGGGSKKLSDFLIDLKVPRERRWKVPVLVAGGEIAALPGLRIDHRFRVTPVSRRIVKVTMQ